MKKHNGEKVTRKHLRKVKKKWVVAATTAVALIGAGGFYADADQVENAEVESTKVHKEERIAADWQANTVKQVENEVATQKSENANEYEIQWGDTLWALSQATGISVSDLAAYNNIVNPDLIYADDHLAGVLSDLKDSTKTVEEVRAEVESVLEKETVKENAVEELAEAVEEEAEEIVEVEEEPAVEEDPAEEPVVEEQEEAVEEVVEAEEAPAEETSEKAVEEESAEEIVEEVPAEEETPASDETEDDAAETEEVVEEELPAEEPEEQEVSEEAEPVSEPEEEETTEEAPVEETPEEENTEEAAAAPAEEIEEAPQEEAVEEEPAEELPAEEPTEEVVEEATEELPEEEVAAEEPAEEMTVEEPVAEDVSEPEQAEEPTAETAAPEEEAPAEEPQPENKQETVDPLFTDESMEPQDNIETEQSDEVVVEPESQVGTPQNFIIPAEGSITSGYGYRKSPLTGENKLHAGIDIAGGGLVVAAQGGTVVKSEYHEGWGNYVKIDHGNGVETLYAHMQDDSVMVSEGDVIDQGAHLGIMGTTGASTGVHLHFEVHINGVQVDPAPYLYMNV